MSRRLRALALLTAALLLAPLPGLAEVQVMVLGSYHFANPGLDLHNAEVDDVLSARRQAELVELIERLASFRPSMVAVEARADALPGRALPGYRRYLSGEGPPDRNEIEQIGYRLARRMGLDQVLGVDAPGEFPFAALQALPPGPAAPPSCSARWTRSARAPGPSSSARAAPAWPRCCARSTAPRRSGPTMPGMSARSAMAPGPNSPAPSCSAAGRPATPRSARGCASRCDPATGCCCCLAPATAICCANACWSSRAGP
ncbi:DUF5694 domain-containing protein [Paucibacter sp. O1-1]|nr:DUF5694 domain-containing protein [Paucibacter sp. O1-1]MDA3827292.1 DUF5694 domain-containing protein [Paucibacter sp. O1-1]